MTTAGIAFEVRVRPVEEVRAAGESPEAYVTRLARAKADAAWDNNFDEIVLGADTVVVLGEQVLEKPVDETDARAMLRRLAGREHAVITGICLRHAGGAEVDSVLTRVWFNGMSEAEIDEYVASGEPMDKAGAYAIQGLASKFVTRIDGCFFNVVGLPISHVYRYWQKLNRDVV